MSPRVLPPLLELTGAVVVRDASELLRIDRLVISEGEKIALVGPNGSGKSLFVQLLTRDVHPLARGLTPSLLLRGTDCWDLLAARALFGVVSSALQATYARDVTVLDTVLSGFFGCVGITSFQEVSPAMVGAAERSLADLGIEQLAGRSMETLSTGEARRALIARALVHDPEILVLDEPYAGLDPTARHNVGETVRTLARGGRGLLLVTHHIEDIPPEVSRAVMLKAGRVFADGSKTELLTSERLSELFGIPAVVEERDGVYRLW